MSFERKIRRKKVNQFVKKIAKEIKASSSLMMKTDHCSVCNKEFVKTKESVKEWYVEVFSQPEPKAILYCPDCCPKDAKKKIEESGKEPA